MAPEQGKAPEPDKLTPTQVQTGAFFMKACGLEGVADQTIEMYGQTNTVSYGIARCSDHLMELTPADIRDMVMTKIDEQTADGPQGPNH